MPHAKLIPAALTAALIISTPALTNLAAQSATQTLNERTYIEIAERILPSVANITLEPKEDPDNPGVDKDYRDFFQFFQDPQNNSMPDWGATVSGSGVLIERKGQLAYVLTNNHVLSLYGPDMQIRLTFHELDESGTEYNKTTEIAGENVRIIGRDELSDLAVIEFPLPDTLDLQPVPFGDSDLVKIGEQVLALGNPLDLNSTVTRGIVSAKSRYLGTEISLEKLLQTDAVIQPGNSGGPLVNLDGRIVGINNAIASRNGLWQGIGFAIPSNDARRISSDLITHGRVMRGFLGIEMQNVRYRADLASNVYRLESANGVFVMKVIPESPAAAAGLLVGDVVLSIDGEQVRDSDEMLRVIANRPVNEEIKLEVVRLTEAMEPQKVQAVATLTERPQNSILREINPPNGSGAPRFLLEEPKVPQQDEMLGLALQEVDEETATGLKVNAIVAGSAGALADLKTGDVLTVVNGKRVKTVEELREALAEPVTGRHIIRFLREGKPQSVSIEATQPDNSLPGSIAPGLPNQ